MEDSTDGPTPEEVEEARWYLNLKNASTSSLHEQAFALSHEDAESDKRWHVVGTLCTRGDVKSFEVAKNLCVSVDMIERELAADLLGRFGETKDDGGGVVYPFIDQAVPLLEKLLDDPEARVVASAVYSLATYSAFEPILARPSLGKHESVFVRFAVACSLDQSESKAAIDTLIELSNDEDDEVRNWATFGLGSISSLDTPEIREAFIQRLDDPNTEVISEALVGLARRKDTRVTPHIEASLRAEWVGELVIEAAGHVASSDLITALEELTSWWEDVPKDVLERALNRCKGK